MNLQASVESGGAQSGGITVDASREIGRNLPYAKYIVFGGDGFSAVKETGVTKINTDVTRGAVRADYSAFLDADEYDGSTVSSVSLSADGETFVCTAEFAPVIKKSGVPLAATFSVVLSTADGSDNLLCGGDNPLSAFLLGARPLGDEVYAVAGDFDAPNGFSVINASGGERVSATLVFTDGGLSVVTEVPASAKDATVFIGGSPVLRTVLRGDEAETLIIPSTTVMGDLCADIDIANAKSVVYCTCGSVNHSDAVLVRAPEKAFGLKNALGFYAGKGAQIKTDETGTYAAIGGDKEIMLISADGGLPKCEYSVARESGDDFAVCHGGSIVRIGEKVTVFDLSGAETEYDLSRGEQNAVVRDGNRLHFARLIGTEIERFLLDGGNVTRLPSLQTGADAKLFCSLFRIGVASESGCYLFNASAGASTEFEYFRLERLETLVSRAGGTDKLRLGGELAVFDENGETTAACVRSGDEFALGKSVPVLPFGDCAVYGDAENGGVMLFDRGKRVLRSVSGYGGKGAASAGRVGDFLLCVSDDGLVSAHYLSGGGAFVYCPSAAAGDKLRVGVRAGKDTFSDREKIKVVFDVKI